NELALIEHSITEMATERGMDRNAALADMRSEFIERVCRDTVVTPSQSAERPRSQRIDRVLTHRIWALPIFFGAMLSIFYLTFNVLGAVLSNLLAMGIDALASIVDRTLTQYDLNPVVHSLVIDGVFAGVGSVLSFLPIIVVLFFFLSILEDTGYMARVAFVMDQLLRKIGLSGRSIVPMLVGFGCSVPAIMATRTLASERDRQMTILLTPFMSCSAKIPIYGVFTAAFFPGKGGLVMASLYLMGILAGILAAKLLGGTVFRGNPVPFVMELPNYRFPSLQSVGRLCWDKAKDFLERAFTVIFIATLVVWFLQTFDVRFNVVDDSADSLLALTGAVLSPLFAPLGFADWRVSTALVTGFIAKESVVSTLGVLTGAAGNVAGALGGLFTTASAVSFLTFTLLYTPCVAAISAVRRELGSGWKAAEVAVGQCAVAWLAAFVVYRLALLL
ncbi:ferrous iron transport protein B, partial [Oscillibacter sp.]|uniref:ferrous iron transport protein B n=1 Tax=Oscillibacter sp. TaxID=1945593 RepID=UPI002899A387